MKTMSRAMGKGGVGGRPRKFGEPSQPVTVTLPDRILGMLRRIDTDRAKAIVKVVDHLSGATVRNPLHVETVEMAPGVGLVLVPAAVSLRRLSWLKMIEVAPNRYLLAVLPGTSVEQIEIAILDLIEDARHSMPDEAPLLEEIRAELALVRRGERLSKAEILCVGM